MTVFNIWNQVLDRIENKVNRHSFQTWFKPTSLVGDDGQTITVRVPSSLFRDWLNKHYAGVISEAIGEVNRPGTSVAFTLDEGLITEPPASPSIPPDIIQSSHSMATAGLNSRYTFDTFIVGPSNQFAHAACRAVAEAPSRSYNPLFIYGGVGLGKTHLMHAVGQYVLHHDRKLRLTYISSERFMNEMIN
ncbi:MAG: chromosomal replication initiator protein DnaA, partial [Acidobacteria bacterium]|nr:chromosomal replication initiator protein DnaA [Acidobacteriota bacterium]